MINCNYWPIANHQNETSKVNQLIEEYSIEYRIKTNLKTTIKNKTSEKLIMYIKFEFVALHLK